jgi:aryl-alcohol dehydrogenase-like predicted oxidoreductase
VLQAPHNLFEREIEADALSDCLTNKIATFGYGALCRGLLSGRMDPKTVFTGDDLRRIDSKFSAPRFSQYLSAVQELDGFAGERFGKRVRIRWNRSGVTGWWLDAAAVANPA